MIDVIPEGVAPIDAATDGPGASSGGLPATGLAAGLEQTMTWARA